MSRKLVVTIHLSLAAFFSPILIIIAISGGLYLIGEKGDIEKEVVFQGSLTEFNFSDDDMSGQVRQFIEKNNISHQFEYVKGGKTFAFTRPTSKQHLLFEASDNQLVVSKRTPNFIASIIELHKGHGPTLFKTYQKLTAVGLLLILVSGLFLGLTSPTYRKMTIAISGIGLMTSLLLIFL